MKSRNYKRQHLRAPLRKRVIYEDSGNVFQAKVLNISEGGMFINELPLFPKQEIFYSIVELPDYPIFQSLDLTLLNESFNQIIKRKVIQLKCKTIRKVEHNSNDMSFIDRGIGLTFIDINFEIKEYIAKYCQKSVNNTVYLKKLFESSSFSDSTKRNIRLICNILGHNPTSSFEELKKEIERDYVNLQWL